MYPRSRNPGAVTSKTMGWNLKKVCTTGTRYDRNPRRCCIRSRLFTTAGANPNPTLLTNHSPPPDTRPTSKRRERPVTSRATSPGGGTEDDMGMKHAADKISSRLPPKSAANYRFPLLGEIALVPIDGKLDAAATAQEFAGLAAQRDTIATRGAHEVPITHFHLTRHIIRPRHHGPFAGWRTRYLEEGTDDRDGCAFHIDDGGEPLGLDQPVPGAAAQIAVHIGLETSPHHP